MTEICYICGHTKMTSEMLVISINDVAKFYCNPEKDPDCKSRQARKFEGWDGERRKRGLEPHDGQVGPPPSDFDVDEDGLKVTSYYKVDGDLYAAVHELDGGACGHAGCTPGNPCVALSFQFINDMAGDEDKKTD